MSSRPPGQVLIGYYVHHQGRGHLHRALALGSELTARGLRVHFLSSLGRPAGLDDDVRWVELPRDDDRTPIEPAPGGLLHWVPRGHAGLRERMAAVSRWIEADRPDLVVSDVSQEITVLCRLHGVPVVSVVLPGDRGDRAHQLGLGLSERLVGFWPEEATRMVSGLPVSLAARLAPLGAMSRFPPDTGRRRTAGADAARRLLVLSGRGGDAWPQVDVATLATVAASWRVEVLGPDRWTDDPWPRLLDADVVVTRAGQASIAEVAAARVPAVVVPAPRPHEEQAHTAAQLGGGGWPALVRPHLSSISAADLRQAAGLDGSGWAAWCDGRAASRFGELVVETVDALDRDRVGQAT